MWLLRTDCAQLRSFVSPEEAIRQEGGFAILSHTWGNSEQTFQDLQRIYRKCETSGENPRNVVCEKIRKCCQLAEQEGYRWVWIDTCCIDKTSSAELTEAINSMWRYYSLSAVCYVYLEDWSGSLFLIKCRWTCRSWTLQELIAPEVVVLLDCRWNAVGTKVDLADELEEATKISASLLRLEQSLGDFSIAQRMSWAARRKATRVEDEAYSLLGIFGINMPTIYGEGAKAFQRLQEEIMRQDPDTTLFAWGTKKPLSQLRAGGQWEDEQSKYLFATRPRNFESSCHIVQAPLNTLTENLGSSLTFTISPFGLQTRISVCEVEPGVVLADFGLQNVALNQPLFLILTQSTVAPDPLRPLFYVGYSRISVPPSDVNEWHHCMVWPDTELDLHWQVKEIFLAHQPPTVSKRLGVPRGLAFANSLHSPFRFSPLRAIRGYSDEPETFRIRLSSVLEPLVSWETSGSAPFRGVALLEMAVDHIHGWRVPRFVVQLGVCYGSSYESSVGGAHWARVDPISRFRQRGTSEFYQSHLCTEDHISDWYGGAKSFMLDEGRPYLQLQFRDQMGTPATRWMDNVKLVPRPRDSLTIMRSRYLRSKSKEDTVQSV